MLEAFVTGLRRVLAAPAILIGVYLVTLGAALPFALVLRASLDDHLGASLMAEDAASSVNWDWWQEFSAQATGLERTFTPAIIGFAAPLSNLSAFVDRTGQPAAVIAAAAGYGALWLFLWGGILDRYARARRLGAPVFFAACGVFFFRFLRLAVMAGALYWVILGPAHEWLFETAYDRLTRDVTVERVGFAWRLGLYAVLGLALAAVNLLVDYAKIRAVVEDRRSMIGALLAGARFLVRRPAGAAGLYLLDTLLLAGVLALYAVGAPGAGGGGLAVWWTLLVGQAYVLARLFVRLTFAATQLCFFQHHLAHAGYAGFSAPAWPESPAVETIVRGARRATAGARATAE
jgi:hypothetical protein